MIVRKYRFLFPPSLPPAPITGHLLSMWAQCWVLRIPRENTCGLATYLCACSESGLGKGHRKGSPCTEAAHKDTNTPVGFPAPCFYLDSPPGATPSEQTFSGLRIPMGHAYLMALTSNTATPKGWPRKWGEEISIFLWPPLKSMLDSWCSLESTQYKRWLSRSWGGERGRGIRPPAWDHSLRLCSSAPPPCSHLQARPPTEAVPGQPSGRMGPGTMRDAGTRPMGLGQGQVLAQPQSEGRAHPG